MVSGTVTQGAVLVISEDMIDKSYAFKCVATNHYYGTTRENYTAVIFSAATGELPYQAASIFYIFSQSYLTLVCSVSYLIKDI